MLRIVAGRYGGRRIRSPPGRRTRPTPESVREAWFSALGGRVVGAGVLDLFAGSGALGLEALSRGARSVIFVESDRRALATLRRNVGELAVGDRVRVEARDAGEFLEEARRKETSFGLALADPPYGSRWPLRLAALLEEWAFASLLCIEHEPGALDGATGIVWERRYGDTALAFLAPSGSGNDREREKEEP